MKDFDLDKAIRKVPDFPHQGILYYDITSILNAPEAYRYCLDRMRELYEKEKFDGVAGVESRGFVFASVFADRAGLPLILVRKAGRLPGVTLKQSYQLEYGKAEIEIHASDIPKGGRILVIDDLLATGGTLRASVDLIREGGATVSDVFGVIGLPFLGFREKLEGVKVHTLIEYDSETA